MVIHSYRVRYGYVPGDPALAAIEEKLAAKPKIAVPTITLQGEAAGTVPPDASIAHVKFFTGPYQRRTIPRVGHNVPQEAPRETAEAVMELVGRHVKLAQLLRSRTSKSADAPSFRVVVNQLKGGDPVSHCHSPITASWIEAASGVRCS